LQLPAQLVLAEVAVDAEVADRALDRRDDDVFPNRSWISLRIESSTPGACASETSQNAGGSHHTRSTVPAEGLAFWVWDTRSLIGTCS
jgi:hypothetical protein